MPAKHSRHVALTGPLAAWAEQQVAVGDYASVSDVVRTALRLLKREGERGIATTETSERGANIE